MPPRRPKVARKAEGPVLVRAQPPPAAARCRPPPGFDRRCRPVGHRLPPAAPAVAIAVGLTAGVLAVLCGARPGWRSLIPMVVVSPVLELTVRTVSTPEDVVGQLGALLAGMVLLALGVGAYIGSENGAGPADLLFSSWPRRACRSGRPASCSMDRCCCSAGRWAVRSTSAPRSSPPGWGHWSPRASRGSTSPPPARQHP